MPPSQDRPEHHGAQEQQDRQDMAAGSAQGLARDAGVQVHGGERTLHGFTAARRAPTWVPAPTCAAPAAQRNTQALRPEVAGGRTKKCRFAVDRRTKK
eukprot:5837648-Prymnesium_polylepis.1